MRIGVVQPDASERAVAPSELAQRVDGECDLIVLPELVVPGYTLDHELLRAAAEPLDGPVVTAALRYTRETGTYLTFGFCEREDDRIYNAAVLVGPNGLLLHYRKLHLFGAEKRFFTPGDRGLPVVETPFGVVGVCICYDLRFVEVVRALTLRGAVLVCAPTAWIPGFDADELRIGDLPGQVAGVLVQANLNHTYVACASYCGTAHGLDFLGHSLVADPFGRTALGPLPRAVADAQGAEIELRSSLEARQRGDGVSPWEDRRADYLELHVGGEVL